MLTCGLTGTYCVKWDKFKLNRLGIVVLKLILNNLIFKGFNAKLILTPLASR